MVVADEPLGEEFVEPFEREAFGEGREELGSDGEEEALDLATALGDVGAGVEECNAEACAGVGQCVRTEGGAVVDVKLAGEAALLEGRDDAVAVALEVLREIEPGVGEETGMVVENGEEVGLC